jgi:ubiquitin carboxyl-terminal hydrolase 6/32
MIHNSPKVNGQPPQVASGVPRSPSHSRSPSNVSIANTTSSESSRSTDRFENFVIGVHRKMNLMDVYFLSSQKSRPSLFGTPIIIPCSDMTTNQELYQFVWTQICRLVSPLPPTELKVTNHAQDCDDSLGYEYPFMLKEVQRDGFLCARCPWFRFCRGCRVECNGELYGKGSSFLAIDWEATALHLRYQATQEKFYEEHLSVAESRQKQTEPIDLDTCLQAFTKWEELDEDELYYCSKCKKHRLAAKKLDIWRLPPILIINLKRFQYVNGRWVKSHKIVNFPLRGFDPSAYLALRDHAEPTTIATPIALESSLHHQQHHWEPAPPISIGGAPISVTTLTNGEPPVACSTTSTIATIRQQPTSASVASSATSANPSLSTLTSGYVTSAVVDHNKNKHQPQKLPVEDGGTPTHQRNIGSSAVNGSSKTGTGSSAIEQRLQEFDHADYTNARYNLYAMSCHTGILGGGHYVAYAKNPNDHWYCYNDSSCKDIPEHQLDKNSAYILFYEREGVDFSHFMPDTTGCEPDMSEIDDEFESDFKKMCVLQ